MNFLTTAAAADRLGVNPRTISKWVRQGRLTPAAKLEGVRGAFLFDPEDIDRLAGERGAA
jgi:excisionase family DNA binding protein